MNISWSSVNYGLSKHSSRLYCYSSVDYLALMAAQAVASLANASIAGFNSPLTQHSGIDPGIFDFSVQIARTTSYITMTYAPNRLAIVFGKKGEYTLLIVTDFDTVIVRLIRHTSKPETVAPTRRSLVLFFACSGSMGFYFRF